MKDLEIGLVPALAATHLVDELGDAATVVRWLQGLAAASIDNPTADFDPTSAPIPASPTDAVAPLMQALGGAEAMQAWILQLEHHLDDRDADELGTGLQLQVHRTPLAAVAHLMDVLGDQDAALQWVHEVMLALVRVTPSDAVADVARPQKWRVPGSPSEAIGPLTEQLGGTVPLRIWIAEVIEQLAIDAGTDS